MEPKTLGIGLLIFVWCGIQLANGLRGGRIFAHGLRTLGPGESGFQGYLAFYGFTTLLGGVWSLLGLFGGR